MDAFFARGEARHAQPLAPESIGLSSPPSRRSRRPVTNADLVEALCAASVTLREARRLHLALYGILIPHVFMEEVLRRMGQCLGAGRLHARAEHAKEIEAILGALEQGMAEGERETRNVVAISFARDSELETFFDELRPLMGPLTRAQVQGR